MEIKKLVSIIASFILVLVLSLSAASAAAGLSVNLLNQNPDPVSPGNFVYLNVKVSNIGDEVIQNAEIIFNENENFQIAKGEELKKNLGSLTAFSSSDNSNSFIVAKYKVLVDDETPSGLNTVSFDVKTSAIKTFNYEFDILVQDANLQLLVKEINVPEIKPGESAKLSLVLENPNSLTLKDVKVALDLANVDERIITLERGSNEKIVGNLESGEVVTVDYDISISPESDSKPYLLPIELSYDDNLENSFENTVYGSVKVYSEPEISLTLDSQEVYTIGRGKFNLAIANPGISNVKGVQLEILDSDDYEIIEGKNQYVGDMNPDDFQTLQGDIYVKNAEAVTLEVKLNYLDSYDRKQEEVRQVDFKIYDQEELNSLGFAGSGNSSGGIFGYLVVIVLTAVVTFFFVRRSFKKKLKSKA